MPDSLPLITACYASLLTLMYLSLSVSVIKSRYKNKVSLLDGDCDELRQRIRIHGNFAEYVPLALIMIGFVELSTPMTWPVHILSLALIIARLLHATGLKAGKGGTPGRKNGVKLTFAVLACSSIWILVITGLTFV